MSTTEGLIDISGRWTSKAGNIKIHLSQTGDKFDGYVGSKDEIKISLGRISGHTINFKQTWHKGVNEGAVVTVYGTIANDKASIMMWYDGSRITGKRIEGRNFIYRDNFMGTWVPSNRSGDVWSFIIKSGGEVSGQLLIRRSSKPLAIVGQRDEADEKVFTFSVESDRSKVITGEYKCPNVTLSFPSSQGGTRTMKLCRKQESMIRKFQEYFPEAGGHEREVLNSAEVRSPRPVREQSQFSGMSTTQSSAGANDLRTPFLSSTYGDRNKYMRNERGTCVCCIVQ